MELSNLAYYIKSGLNDAKYNSAMSISSIIIVIAGLCVFGIYTLVSSNVSYLSRQLCNQYSITAYIEKGTPEDRGEEIREEIGNIPGVRSVEYVTEAMALEECRKMFGDDSGFLDGLEEDNPLRGSMIINIDNVSEYREISEKVKNVIDVVWVKDDSSLADKLVSSTSFIRHVSLILFVVFLAISLFIISNTIRLTILAKRNDIHTMRYLGATNKFIIIPFVVEGIAIGIIGAVIAYCIIIGSYAYLFGRIQSYMNGMLSIYSPLAVAFPLFGANLLTGTFLGGLSSVFPLIKYMRV